MTGTVPKVTLQWVTWISTQSNLLSFRPFIYQKVANEGMIKIKKQLIFVLQIKGLLLVPIK